jgi:hyperosmotically inducible periplasmic protein
MPNLNRGRALITTFAIGTSLTALLAGGCGKTISDALDDTTITTRVKTAMLNDPGVGGLGIDVDTLRSVVTLSGRVKTQAEREQAIDLARRVNGVSEVRDSLQVAADDVKTLPPPIAQPGAVP